MPFQGFPAIMTAGGRSSGVTPWSAGFDFRANLGFVTDASGFTGVTPAKTYPTTESIGGISVTFGWETTSGLDARDRDAGVDPRIAGINFHPNVDTNTDIFRVDLLTATNYSIVLAIGDGAGANAQVNYIEVRDTTTPLITFAPINTDSSHFADAAGNFWTPAQWPASNVPVVEAFSTAILRVVIGGTNTGSASSCIANLTVIKV